VIITKSTPYTKGEIKKLKELFDQYVKTVIDVKRKICSAGCDRHFESEEILLREGSNQSDIWGGGIDLETKLIDFNAFINIRSKDDNTSSDIQDSKIREEYKKLTEYFFKEVL
jgi:hypothetical protein